MKGGFLMKRKTLPNCIGRTLATVILAGSLFGAQKPIAAEAAVPSEFTLIFDATYYAAKYPDAAAMCGGDENMLLAHFVNYGIPEGRQGSAAFDVNLYISKYPDLQAAFGQDMASYYVHYMTFGYAEGRTAANAAANTAASKPATTTNASVGSDPRNMNDQARWDLQAAINKFRAGYGRQMMGNSTEIIDAAQIRADELTKKYDRIRPDGRNGDSVLDDKAVPRHYYRELLYRSNSGDFNTVLDEWTKANADVRNILLYPQFTQIGVGHREVNGTHYWVIELTDGHNDLKEGSTSESGNYVRERFRTDAEKATDDQNEYEKQYWSEHSRD